MSDFGILAIRPPQEAKTRLAPLLPPDAREALAWSMLRHVLGCMIAVIPAEACILVSRSAEVLGLAREAGAIALAEAGADQNAALTQAARHAAGRGAGRILSISSDLPLLTEGDVRALLAGCGDRGLALAPDRHGLGTNALCMAPPLAIPYLHGSGSLARHVAMARQAGLPAVLIRRPGLAHDVDEPGDMLLPEA